MEDKAAIEKTIRDYLPQIVHMSLATTKDNKPWVCEVHFAYDDKLHLYFRSLASRRHSQEIGENPHVAGNIVKQHPLGAIPLGVYFEGTAKKLESDEDRQEAFAWLSARLESDNSELEESRRPDGHQFYKITVDNWYVFGKVGNSGVQKHHLPWAGSNPAA